LKQFYGYLQTLAVTSFRAKVIALFLISSMNLVIYQCELNFLIMSLSLEAPYIET